MLGKRQPELYGSQTLEEINDFLRRSYDTDFEFFQSNHEGDIVDKIQQTNAEGVIINAGAFTHYSIAIRDAILSRDITFVEVHLTDPKKREAFRHISLIEDVCAATFSGKKAQSYAEAAEFLLKVGAKK
jgi:3-dehydroquinate dehydratase-2